MNAIETTATNATGIGFYAGDEFGSDGWWEEGATESEVTAAAEKNALACGFDCAPQLVFVAVAKLGDLSDDEWSTLESQWRLSRRNRWVSVGVDSALKAEKARRESIS